MWKRSKEYWEPIKEYLRLTLISWFALLAFAAMVIAVFSGIFESFNTPSWVWITIAVFGIFIAQFRAFHKVRVQSPVVSNKTTRLEKLAADDLANLGTRIKINVERGDFGGITSPEPYFEVFVRITNTTVFTVKLVEVKGFAQIMSHPCQADVKLTQRPSLAHGDTRPIRLRQNITPETAQVLKSARDKDEALGFLFTEVKLVFEVTTEGYEDSRTEIVLYEAGLSWVPKP